MPQSYITRNVSHNDRRPLFTLSAAAVVFGRISLLASAVVVASPSLSSVGVSDIFVPHAPIDNFLSLQIAISHTNDDRVLVKIEGENCHIVAEGKEVENQLSLIEHHEGNGNIELYFLAPKSEVYPLKTIGEKHAVKDLARASIWLDDYRDFRKSISRDVEQSIQGLDGLSNILSFLDIAANVIEVVGAAGGISLWLIRKLIKRHQDNANPIIRKYIAQVESITDFYEKTPKARIAEISASTGIPKENLPHLLKSLSFGHEPACFWSPPVIQAELLKPALALAKKKRKFRPIATFIVKLFLIGVIIGGMVFAINSGLNATASTFLLMITLLLILFIIAK